MPVKGALSCDGGSHDTAFQLSLYASVLARAKDLRVLAVLVPSPAILYYTINTSRVKGNENKRQLEVIRQLVESEMQTTEGHKSWRCMVVTKDPRNSA
jgi:hypothetical protein